ncbi:MAG: RiPP maturation radical SAM C-methyltransferase [Xanthobacteraceae bacterium]
MAATGEVVLVLMPYASVERPSVALGTLQACLRRAGITTRSLYANLRFADRLGLQGYESINGSAISNRIGEWTFAEAAFPDADLRPQAYLETLSALLGDPPELIEQLARVRALATAFVGDMAHAVLSGHPRIVGCSSMFQQQCASLALLRRVRELDPSVVTMLGGGNCEGEMGWTAHQSFDWIDFTISGEADELLPDLCRAILDCGRDVPASLLAPGIFAPAHRTAGEAPTPPQRALYARVRRMDRLPVPSYEDYFEELDRARFKPRVLPGIAIETARGCWWGEKHHCSFCGISDSGMLFRGKRAEQIIDELDELFTRHRIGRFVTADNIIEPSYFESLMPALIDAGRGYGLFYQTKANLKRRQVELLAASGVRWIQPGIESLDDRVLPLLEKGASAAINLQLIKWSRQYGVWLLWNMLFGAPGEDDAWYSELAAWLPLIYHLQPPSTQEMTAIRYNRFSPYFERAGEFGLDLVPYWAYQHTYPHDAERRARQAYYFYDRRDAANSARPWSRPGVRAVNDRLREWTALFLDREAAPIPTVRFDAPVLVAKPDGDGMIIRDTRPCAVASRHRLSPVETRVYRACDVANSSAAIVSTLERTGAAASASQVDDILGGFAERKLMLAFGHRFLALAVDEPMSAYGDPLDFPAGLLLPDRAAAEPPSPPLDSAWDVPVAALPQFVTANQRSASP